MQYPFVHQSSSWALIAGSAFSLLLAALYFQYIDDLAPCIMCIYQRTAVVGILVFTTIPTLINHVITRVVAIVGMAASSVWGLLIAIEHVDIQTAVNPFFASCEIVPNFPSWAPLHQWFPKIFAATGDCGDIKWALFDMSMPQWMIVIFAIYTAMSLGLAFLATRKTSLNPIN